MPVMWSEIVRLRTRPVSDQKTALRLGLRLRLARGGLGLAGLLCYETPFCYARRHNDLEGHSDFSIIIYSFSILYWEDHYCGGQQWPFTYLKVKSVDLHLFIITQQVHHCS